jgi:hypothetical protein
MKSITKLVLSALATAMIPTATLEAGSDVVTSHRPMHSHTTVGIAHSTITQAAVKTGALVYHQVSTGQNTVGYFAPAR